MRTMMCAALVNHTESRKCQIWLSTGQIFSKVHARMHLKESPFSNFSGKDLKTPILGCLRRLVRLCTLLFKILDAPQPL